MPYTPAYLSGSGPLWRATEGQPVATASADCCCDDLQYRELRKCSDGSLSGKWVESDSSVTADRYWRDLDTGLCLYEDVDDDLETTHGTFLLNAVPTTQCWDPCSYECPGCDYASPAVRLTISGLQDCCHQITQILKWKGSQLNGTYTLPFVGDTSNCVWGTTDTVDVEEYDTVDCTGSLLGTASETMDIFVSYSGGTWSVTISWATDGTYVMFFCDVEGTCTVAGTGENETTCMGGVGSRGIGEGGTATVTPL